MRRYASGGRILPVKSVNRKTGKENTLKSIQLEGNNELSAGMEEAARKVDDETLKDWAKSRRPISSDDDIRGQDVGLDSGVKAEVIKRKRRKAGKK